MEAELMLDISDLKQYLYCPRVVWYRYCQPVHRPVTPKMARGTEAGTEVAGREERRSLRAYNIDRGERSFEVRGRSEQFGLSGVLDMLITTPTERVPVEFKNANRVARNHTYQLAAYSLLLAETDGPPIERGFVYLIPTKQAHEVIVTAGMRSYIVRALNDMRRMIAEERYPAPTTFRARHADCEYRPYCVDID